MKRPAETDTLERLESRHAPQGAAAPVVRIAVRADLDRLASIELEVFGIDRYDRAQLLSLLDDDECFVHVVEADGAVVGCAITELVSLSEFASRYELPFERLPCRGDHGDERIAYFKSIAVLRRYRRRGAGRRLHETRISLLAELGIDSVFTIQMRRQGLPDFHAALGFSPLDLEPNHRYRSGGRGSVWHRFVRS